MIEKQFPLNSFQIVLLVLVFFTQTLTLVSNVISIVCVYHWKRRRVITRPKLLIVNIALSDTLLILESLLPRYVLVPIVIDSHPFSAHVIQSVSNYVNALTLYVTSMTMTVIACDRYCAITRVFSNPMDRVSTKAMIITIWCLSVLFSIPFVITTDVYHYDYSNHAIVCSNSEHYLPEVTSNKPFKQSTRIFRIVFEFFVPTIVVIYYTIRIVWELYKNKNRSTVTNSIFESNIKRHEITKRLIFILSLFTVRNLAFHLVSVKSNFNFHQTVITSCQIAASYFTYYVIVQITGSIYSVAYFWLSTEFRTEVWYLLKYRGFRRRTHSREPFIPMNGHIIAGRTISGGSQCSQQSF